MKLPPNGYLLRQFDHVPRQAAVVEPFLPKGEIWQWKGIVFVPPEIGVELGEPTDALLSGTMAFPAWSYPLARAPQSHVPPSNVPPGHTTQGVIGKPGG